MTRRERLLMAIRHEEPDYVPNNPRIYAWLMEYYGGGDYRIHLQAAGEFDLDPIITIDGWIPNIVYSHIEDTHAFPDIRVEASASRDDRGIVRLLRTIRTPAGKLEDETLYPPAGGIYGISPNPERLEYLIKEEDDIDKVRYLLPDPARFVLKNLDQVKEAVGDQGLVQLRPHFGADHLLVDAVGLTQAMVLYYENRPMLQELVGLFGRYYRKCIECALSYRPDVLFDSWYNCSLSAGWSPAIWRDLFFPHIRANRKLVEDAGVYYHYYDDGKFMGLLPELKELAPDIFSTVCPPPVGDADLPGVKRELGDRVCLNGYVDLQTVLRGTTKRVEDEVRYAIETAARGGGFILGTSDSIRNGSPLENVLSYSRAARRYGKYPVR